MLNRLLLHFRYGAAELSRLPPTVAGVGAVVEEK